MDTANSWNHFDITFFLVNIVFSTGTLEKKVETFENISILIF